ncbi:hypothetical protein POMI540_2018 [Schizosaccharomyces pombe]|uniref:Probable urea active transporter 3 n=1 Tax=Schizosaccharomyces pombe (strain 972 / ATCC 24843) TaxID=284812 RepID=DUR33_SCHPO|nr:putative urea transporter [Schizosaccharomyces pombe]Q9URY6.1 RecName: Full=Probable urea active transporter 3 [Schizosaccharomyces pombe 972h-]CAB60013.1 urea transporter (predicted) [Schizosaccharomyces pombe]|eukprot:NP_595016.1 putative urea transporter [Schizosaccharomyces pombe]
MTETVLNQGYGYGIVIGLGFAFAIVMILVTYVLKRYVGEVQDSEHFTTASRSVKTGLISSAVVSSWTWPGTLLTSAGMAYEYGVCGSMWYSFAFTVQITFFTVIALQVKRVAPGAHTIVEIVKARFGQASHAVFLFYALGTNIIVSAMLLLGGSQAISAITGMHVVAAGFLLPLGVWLYTVSGGLKSTFLSDWTHTVIVYIVILITLFVAYTSSVHIGSIDKMYDLLTEVSKTNPSTGYKGSYLTVTNRDAVFVGWNIVIGGFATVFCDPSYGQKAIAAKPISAMKGYFAGGLAWLIVPWAMGSAAALSCLALTNNPVSVTYPDPVSSKQVSEGMPLLYGMTALMGKNGAAAGVLILFMASTSATSAELVAFSSVMTYDVYRNYFRPNASGKELVRVTHVFVTIFAVCMGALAVLFNYIGITISWIITFIGIALGPAVFGITLTLFWKKMNKYGMIIGCPMGSITGVVCWVGSCYKFSNGVVNKTTLNTPYANAVGNFTGLFSGLIYIVLISYFFPNKSDDLNNLNEKFVLGDDATAEEIVDAETEKKQLDRSLRIGIFVSWIIFFILVIIVPLPMYGSKYIFSKLFFRGWIIVIIIWTLIAALYITFYPLYESRDTIVYLCKLAIGKAKAPEPMNYVDAVEVEIESLSDDDKEKKANDFL